MGKWTRGVCEGKGFSKLKILFYDYWSKGKNLCDCEILHFLILSNSMTIFISRVSMFSSFFENFKFDL